MWALIGEQHDGIEVVNTDIVALFTTKDKAVDYLHKSKKKKSNPWQYGDTYLQRSLLGAYDHAYVKKYEEPQYIIDPEIKKNETRTRKKTRYGFPQPLFKGWRSSRRNLYVLGV